MLRKSFVFLVMGMVIFFFASISSADVPHMINYQGKLTTATGGCLNDTVQMTFSIYPDTLGSPSDWTETQTQVIVREGIFSVLLGSVHPIPAGDTVFDGSTKYLGVKVESDPEMRPLKPMVSVAYAFRAGGGGEVNCHDCDTVFVNVVGPDSVVATSGTAFKGTASGSGSIARGIEGYADNSSSGSAYGGVFRTSSSGTGTHFGIQASAVGNSSSNTYGSYSYATNLSSGQAWGGYFRASDEGTGTGFLYGVSGSALGSSSNPSYGCYGSSDNTSSGDVYGGYFVATSSGTGTHVGVMGHGSGSYSTSAFGFHGIAENFSTGAAYGGHFRTGENGTGPHYGVSGTAGGSPSAASFGCYGYAYNILGVGPVHGCYGYGANTSTGNVYGGYFEAADTGTGTKYGIYAKAPTDEGWAGYFQGDVQITDSLVVLGGKSVAVKVDNGEYRLLYCQESPENWFEDFGEGRLIDGEAVIQIDPLFAQTVNTSVKYHVFLTPQDEPLTLAVANKTATSFEVIGSAGANISFSYRIVAKRKGYENIRLAKMGGPTPEEVEAEQERFQAEREQERARMEQERMEMEKERELR